MSDSRLCVLHTLACVRRRDADFDEGVWKHRELRVNRLGGGVNMKEMLSHFKSAARKRKNVSCVYFWSRIFSKGHAVVITTRRRKESVTAWRRLEEASERMRQEFWFRKVFPTWRQDGKDGKTTATENKVKNWRARQRLVQSWRWLDRDSETLFSRVILEIVRRTRLWEKIKKK